MVGTFRRKAGAGRFCAKPRRSPRNADVRLQALPAFNDNYIWLLHDDAGRAPVVDPGQAEPVLAAPDAGGWRPRAILLTPPPPDHVGGPVQLQARPPAPTDSPPAYPLPTAS